MSKQISIITTALILGLSSAQASAHAFYTYTVNTWFGSWTIIFPHFHSPILTGGGSGNSVPELSLTAGPLAVAVILGIVGIGFERRRRKNKK